MPEEMAGISPHDRGFLIGDAVFETLRAYSGRPLDLDAHVARLRRSANIVGIPFPKLDFPLVLEVLLEANDLLASDASVRITLTAGEGGQGLSRIGSGPPTILATAKPVAVKDEWYRDGIGLVVAERTRRAPPEVLDPRVKSANYLPHVLARREAEARGADDAILLNMAGNVCEATTANVFVVIDGEVVTPPLDSGCLDGITRERVLELLNGMSYAVGERALAPQHLADADEIFLTSSVAEVVPATRFEGKPVGRVQPGPVARAALKAYRALATRG